MSRMRSAWLSGLAVVLAQTLSGAASASSTLADRITRAVSVRSTVPVEGTAQPLAQARFETGRLEGSTMLHGVSMQFRLSAAQAADLAELQRQQQDSASENYHRWLTPEAYGLRFGLSDSDLAKVKLWLQSQGFTIDGVAPSRNQISFSGTAAQIETSFGTSLRTYVIDGRQQFSNAAAISVPSALSGVILGVRNLSGFRLKPRLRSTAVSPKFTSSISGSHYLAPADFATIYDVAALYSSGYTGSGQKIAVVGQTAIEPSDIAAFRSASGLSSATPTLVLVPNSGTSTISSDDEAEADLDVEWSGGVAKDATIVYVYTGNSANYTVINALEYAIQQNLAPIVSVSYGACEANFSSSDISTLEADLKQAGTQGQTVLAATGDDGAADCDASTAAVNSATHGLAVDYPSSSTYVTGIGGTRFDEGTGDYWSATNSSSNESALSYIPEVAWNDTGSTGTLDASGGGKSKLFGKPTWQTGVGVPSDGQRDVPDIALAASPNHDGYLVCSAGSCVNGFRNTNTTLTVVGGTSVGPPSFAGVLALINQKTGSSGQGAINATLYKVAAASGMAFHDITSGNNQVPCTSGSTDCGSAGIIGYTTNTGYDLVTGLGTIDALQLATQWPASSASSGGTSGGASTSSGGGGALPPIGVLGLLAATLARRRRRLSSARLSGV